MTHEIMLGKVSDYFAVSGKGPGHTPKAEESTRISQRVSASGPNCDRAITSRTVTPRFYATLHVLLR
jgi:hypothetical protein